MKARISLKEKAEVLVKNLNSKGLNKEQEKSFYEKRNMLSKYYLLSDLRKAGYFN
jgi:hypothetical protein